MFSNSKHLIWGIFFFILAPFLFNSCKPSEQTIRKLYEHGLSQQPYDAIIVPGFTYTGQPWNDVLNTRIRWANYLYKQGYTRNIIFSGSAVRTKYYESKVMALFAEAMGV
ncbi:MAG: ElyC/SanA/YdcF family protein, partial [Bacteroidota bacterium]